MASDLQALEVAEFSDWEEDGSIEGVDLAGLEVGGWEGESPDWPCGAASALSRGQVADAFSEEGLSVLSEGKPDACLAGEESGLSRGERDAFSGGAFSARRASALSLEGPDACLEGPGAARPWGERGGPCAGVGSAA